MRLDLGRSGSAVESGVQRVDAAAMPRAAEQSAGGTCSTGPDGPEIQEITQGGDVPAGVAKPQTQHPQPATGESRERRPVTQERGNMVARRTPSETGVTAGETALSADRRKGRGVEGHADSPRDRNRTEIGSSWPATDPIDPRVGPTGPAGIKPGRPFFRFVLSLRQEVCLASDTPCRAVPRGGTRLGTILPRGFPEEKRHG